MIGSSLGSYRVVKKLGEGGMGVVFEAQHLVLGKRVVVKMLRAELSTNPELVTRFFNEARSTAHIKHEGIVEVLDFGQDSHGAAFIVMEYLDGESLAARLRRDGRLAFDLAAVIARQAASAVHAAHQLGIVHRDLKPDNLFLVPDRELSHGVRVKVLDFGIAKLLDGDVVADVKTRTGAVLGTPFYMSPEQCRGAQQIDHRSDIYALGCILYEMVCGCPPFRAAGLGDLIVMHVTEPPVPPHTLVPGMPPRLEAAILRALAKKPWERQQSGEELATELQNLWTQPGAGSGQRLVPADAYQPTARHPSSHEPTLLSPPAIATPVRKPRTAAVGLVLAVLGVVAVASVAAYVVARGPTPAPTGGSGGASGTIASGSASSGAGAGVAQRDARLACGDPAACMAAAAKLGGAAALAIYDPLCRQGHAPACNRAGVIAGGGTGEVPDLDRAALAFKASCDLHDPEGCFRLGLDYHNGEGVAFDSARATALLDTACAAGIGDACAVLGSDFMDGDHGVAADPARAVVLNGKACDRGVLPACTNLGYQLETGSGAPVDLARARSLYETACGPTSAKACEDLCMVHVFGKGVDKDEAAALPSCKKGCELGDASACTWTGFLYTKHGGVPVDGKAGLAFFEQGCGGGDPKGCFGGGHLLDEGAVIARDPARARELYEKACDSNNSPEACTNLGVMIADGKGGKADLKRALELFESACAGSDGLGCFKAGRFYHFGFGGLRRDEARARDYFDRACKRNPSTCGKRPDDL